MNSIIKYFKFIPDFTITMSLWVLYIFGFAFLYMPCLIVAFPLSRDREAMFQKLNHIFYGFFFSF